ncbi:MAG TPA: HlyD family type I secretion periplasmic adaptor subunit [Synergistales bacterium]|nr:HlyD family type I secretion periplasmic adaptor subunit [Synergistales bacterium]
MAGPFGKKEFDRAGRLISAAEQVGDKVTGGIFNRLFSGEADGPYDWGTDAEWAIEEQKPISSRIIIYCLFVTLVLLLAWASYSSLDDVVRGMGKVTPTSGTQLIQAVDGGVIKEILVKESDLVEKDAVIVKIDSTRFTSSFGERRAQIMALTAKAARLEALIKGHDFQAPEEVVEAAPNVVEHERRLYRTSLDELNSAISVGRDRVSQRRQELVESTSRLGQLSTAFDLAKEELNATRSLLESGAISPLEVKRLEKEVARARGDWDQAKAQVSRVKSSVMEAEGQVREVSLRYKNNWSNELSVTMANLESLIEGNKALEDRVSQSEVRSPARGVVKRLFVNTVGAVVMPGGAIAEVVSEEDELVIEARLSPSDRAFVKPGQDVVVKFTAYEYAIYGGLDGKVEYISPDTIVDERGGTFYTVRVKTAKTTLGQNRPILPGMVAQVDVVIGKKTVLSYILKPLFRAKEKALREH